jgi:hypothetical protein
VISSAYRNFGWPGRGGIQFKGNYGDARIDCSDHFAKPFPVRGRVAAPQSRPPLGGDLGFAI